MEGAHLLEMGTQLRIRDVATGTIEQGPGLGQTALGKRGQHGATRQPMEPRTAVMSKMPFGHGGREPGLEALEGAAIGAGEMAKRKGQDLPRTEGVAIDLALARLIGPITNRLESTGLGAIAEGKDDIGVTATLRGIGQHLDQPGGALGTDPLCLFPGKPLEEARPDQGLSGVRIERLGPNGGDEDEGEEEQAEARRPES